MKLHVFTDSNIQLGIEYNAALMGPSGNKVYMLFHEFEYQIRAEIIGYTGYVGSPLYTIQFITRILPDCSTIQVDNNIK